MVRRGSPVRVRKRALQKRRTCALFRSDLFGRRGMCGGYGASDGAFRSKVPNRKCPFSVDSLGPAAHGPLLPRHSSARTACGVRRDLTKRKQGRNKNASEARSSREGGGEEKRSDRDSEKHGADQNADDRAADAAESPEAERLQQDELAKLPVCPTDGAQRCELTRGSKVDYVAAPLRPPRLCNQHRRARSEPAKTGEIH
jgi:hypothetical protein